jgi:hypothetical protein
LGTFKALWKMNERRRDSCWQEERKASRDKEGDERRKGQQEDGPVRKVKGMGEEGLVLPRIRKTCL